MTTGSWTGTSPRGIYKPAIDEPEGILTSGAWKNFDTSLDNIHNKIWTYNWVNLVSDYSADNTGTNDCSTAFSNAISALSSGGTLFIPPGVYKITSGITINQDIRVLGCNHTSTATSAERAPTTILKNGNFVGITISADDVSMEGVQVDGAASNGNDGIQITGGRVDLRRVAVTNQGGNGIRIGDTAGSNVNHFYLERIIAISNGDNGVYIHDGSGGGPNTNAGTIMGLDTRGNTNDGLEIGNSTDNQIFGLVAQTNGGYGIHLTGSAMGNAFYHPYLESNTTGQGIMDASSQDNHIWGYRQGVNQDGWTNNGTNNTILGRYNYLESINQMTFEKIILQDRTISGRWEIDKNTTNRYLDIELNGSDADAVVNIKSAGAGEASLGVAGYLAAGFNTGPRIYAGTGTPEGNKTAYLGSIFQRYDGGIGTGIYFKESGNNQNYGWWSRVVEHDNTDAATDGTGEDDLQSTTITANSLGATGGVRILAAGTKAGANDDKTIKLHFGSTSWTVHAAANDANDWRVQAEIVNVDTGHQRISWVAWNGATVAQGYETSSEDTTAAVTLKMTGECAHADDTITQTMWIVERL